MKSALLVLLFLAAPAVHAAAGLWFDRIFTLVFENTGIARTLAQSADFASFAQKGRLFTNYFAQTHPSQPNYLHMVCVHCASPPHVPGRRLRVWRDE